MTRSLLPAVGAAGLLLAGCGKRWVCERLREHNRRQCLEGPPPLIDEYLRRSAVPYEDYRREHRRNGAG